MLIVGIWWHPILPFSLNIIYGIIRKSSEIVVSRRKLTNVFFLAFINHRIMMCARRPYCSLGTELQGRSSTRSDQKHVKAPPPVGISCESILWRKLTGVLGEPLVILKSTNSSPHIWHKPDMNPNHSGGKIERLQLHHPDSPIFIIAAHMLYENVTWHWFPKTFKLYKIM